MRTQRGTSGQIPTAVADTIDATKARLQRLILALLGVAALASAATAVAVHWYDTRARAAAYTLEDPTDPAPAYPHVDLAALATPACPLAEPAKAPTPDASSHRLIDWGAVRVVRCVYEPGRQLSVMDVIEGGQTVPMSQVMRRLLTPAQREDLTPDGAVRSDNLALMSPVRYLFQYGDGHVVEVATNNGGYYRDTTVRYGLPRGRDMAALAVPGQRACGLSGLTAGRYRACQVDADTAMVPTT
ncbi:hypothetical protein R8Z50_35280 [Longispora sp. K20-0274]|uniref:hypothetical protein n=1 Tax=Longispora sp. K20-0274 TaxID=3088255 RepID=UPI00399A0CF3